MFPHNSYAKVITPSTSEFGCIGNRAFKEIIKVNEVIWMGPNEMTGVLIKEIRTQTMGFPSGLMVRNPLAKRRCRFNPWVSKMLWRRKWQPTPVFLPGEVCGQKTLAGYSPWCRKESDMTE